jgi:AcrR family transcriptional regulator
VKSRSQKALAVPVADVAHSLKPGGRAARRDRIRAELITIGLDSFKQKGFEATTVNDIVEAAGLSPRTFFRYFKTKDDLVFDWMDRQGEFVGPLLSARPLAESPLIAMERTFLQLAEHHDANRKMTSFLTHLIFDTPSLNGRYHLEHAKWESVFVDILRRSRALPSAELFALRVQVSVAITAFVTAIRSWSAERKVQPLSPWIAAAFEALNDAVKQAPLAAARRSRRARSPS